MVQTNILIRSMGPVSELDMVGSNGTLYTLLRLPNMRKHFISLRIIRWTATSDNIGGTPGCHSSVPSVLFPFLSRCSKGFGGPTPTFTTANTLMFTLLRYPTNC